MSRALLLLALLACGEEPVPPAPPPPAKRAPREPFVPLELPHLEWRKTASVVAAGDGALAAALASAGPRDILLLQPGEHEAPRLERGAILIAEGEAILRGPLVVAADQDVVLIGLAVPDGAEITSHAVLQDVEMGNLAVSGARVHVVDCDVTGLATLRQAELVTTRSRLASVDAEGGLLLLNETSVVGGLSLRGTRGLVSASDTIAVATPRLDEGSSLLWSGGLIPGEPEIVDALSELVPMPTPLPSVRFSGNPTEGGKLAIEVRGAPRSTGLLFVGPATTLRRFRWEYAFAQIDPAGGLVKLPVSLPDSGLLRMDVTIPEGLLRPGDGVFAQVALRSSRLRPYTLSLLEGGVLMSPRGL